ncbi:hypothetical protein AJ80_02191 [Polytolypa hystricis UAMH7299]|uniref:Uncharacterized protein n=1 Tax=Polytolypa hystricis (strain UAMH7299) TaxID=1447883 RepID=A0A2B7YRT2_POLH7|nr:hypothetical protein AJ80_02191 [Polytolypa hystricis UAMH7299]
MDEGLKLDWMLSNYLISTVPEGSQESLLNTNGWRSIWSDYAGKAASKSLELTRMRSMHGD